MEVNSYHVGSGRNREIQPEGSGRSLECTSNLFSVFGSEDGVQVRCELSDVGERGTAEKLDIMIKPYWSPMGATRFLELVRQGYFDGVALNRVVPKFLTQVSLSSVTELISFVF